MFGDLVPFTQHDGHDGFAKVGGGNVRYLSSGVTRTAGGSAFLITILCLNGACSGTSSVYFSPSAPALDAGPGVVATGGGAPSGSGPSTGGSGSSSGSSSSGGSSS